MRAELSRRRHGILRPAERHRLGRDAVRAAYHRRQQAGAPGNKRRLRRRQLQGIFCLLPFC